MSVPGIQEFRDQNYAEALPLLTESAQAGDAEAQCMLGNVYLLGLGGIVVDEAEAIRWYHRSANQGYSVATRNLAGVVWPISREAAVALRKLAAQQNAAQTTVEAKTQTKAQTKTQATALSA